MLVPQASVTDARDGQLGVSRNGELAGGRPTGSDSGVSNNGDAQRSDANTCDVRISRGLGRDAPPEAPSLVISAQACSVSGDHRISTRGTYRSAHLSVVTPARSAREDRAQYATIASVADTRRLTREDILGHTPSVHHASVTTTRDDHSGVSRNEEGAGYPSVSSSRRGGDRTRPTGIASAVAASRATRPSARGHNGRDTRMSIPREYTPPPRLTGRQSGIRALAGGSASLASAITRLLAPTRPRPSSRPPN